MWITNIVLIGCIITASLAVDENRPKKKDADNRGKRNLQYSISHHHNGPYSYRAERRISTSPQLPQYQLQFYPGPRPYTPFHNKGRPYSFPVPPYAVQMEPLIQYSQRDPLYDTNILSLNADGRNDLTKTEDLLTDTNHLSENIYGSHKQIIERPVYIKEPEPIIEIIIKESNVTLPPLPPPPTPPPKKKEQVQVFYVKYKKNPNGHGKDSVIYDKPIPAISPTIHDEVHDEAPPPPQYHQHQELVTSPPPPSTTLRTIIRPDSETYHSPSGVKVTFGKEGFDYEKRSNKPEDLKPDHSIQFPQGRQLSSFPTNFPRRPSFQFPPSNYRSEPSRPPQSYRPFNQPPNFRQIPQQQFGNQYSTIPKYIQFPPQQPPVIKSQRPALPQFSQPHQQSPPQQQQQQINQPRQPVPYKPFENLRPQQQSPPLPQQQIQFRPQTHFPVNQQLPLTQKQHVFNQFPHQQQQPQLQHNHQQFQQQNHPIPLHNQPLQYNHAPQQNHLNLQQNPSPSQQPNLQNHRLQFQTNQEVVRQQEQPRHQLNIPQSQPHQIQHNIPQGHSQLQQNIPPTHPQHPSHITQPQQNLRQPQQLQFEQQQQHILPPGGELIQSVPKYEQHISILESSQSQQPQALALQQQLHPQQQQQQLNQHLSPTDYNQKIQQQFQQANILQQSIRQPSQLTTPKTIYQTTTQPTTSTTTTQEPEKPSTTTKDPNVLNAKLPDEVPDDLREQLLSSGILNNADISILDYDKVGDIPLSALPPDQLANFYNAGGAQQISAAGSEPIPAIAEPEDELDQEPEASEIDEVKTIPDVQMKVVHYNPDTEQGQKVQETYVKEGATQVNPVVLNGEKYNRYLPLKVSGTQFPLPDVPELKGKKISSVVVLAPVTYDFSSNNRKTRDTQTNKDIELIHDTNLKELLKNPTSENYKKFLDNENKTRSDKQSVILLVIGPDEVNKDKEIFMYDVATRSVSKLNGELSAAFVEAAEANASTDETESQPATSNIVETRIAYNGQIASYHQSDDLDDSASDLIESKVPIIDPMQKDLDTDASEQLESFVDISGRPVDLATAASELHSLDNNFFISGGYSKTGRLLPSV